MKLNWECAQSERLGGWVVEAIGDDGEMYVAQFYGPQAKERAYEYQSWKNNVKLEPQHLRA